MNLIEILAHDSGLRVGQLKCVGQLVDCCAQSGDETTPTIMANKEESELIN